MIYGYARCSTSEQYQDINRQVRELKQQGATDDTIYLEYESGMKENRVELNKLLKVVGPGDSIVSTEVSRITRSTKQLCEIIEFAKETNIKLVMGTFEVDCTKKLDPMTEGMLKMMGVFSELERNIISQRVKSGMENAKAKGKTTTS
jgi:DNA invertase Pin-like site-specific DNA recombinase